MLIKDVKDAYMQCHSLAANGRPLHGPAPADRAERTERAEGAVCTRVKRSRGMRRERAPLERARPLRTLPSGLPTPPLPLTSPSSPAEAGGAEAAWSTWAEAAPLLRLKRCCHDMSRLHQHTHG